MKICSILYINRKLQIKTTMRYCYTLFVCWCLVTKSCPALLQPHGLQPTRLLCPWDFPGKNTGVGCHFLLQGIFPTQGLNPCLLHWQVSSLPLSHQGSPFTLIRMTKIQNPGDTKCWQGFGATGALIHCW